MGGYSTNQIDLVVSSSGVSESAEKVIILAAASERAEAGVNRLKTALRDIGGSSGLGALLSELGSTSAGTQALAAQTANLTNAQRAANEASVGSARARQQESTSIRGLIGTKAELRAVEQAMAQEDKQASAAAKQYLAEEAATRRALTQDILREASASAELRAQKNAQVIATERQIAVETQLARAQELAALASDIKQRSPAIVASQGATAEAVAMNEEYNASKAAQAAINEELMAQQQWLSESAVTMTSALATETGEISIQSAAYMQLAEAQSEVNAAKQLMRAVSEGVSEGYLTEAEGINATAFAMERQAETTQALISAKANLADVTAYLNSATQVEIDVTRMAEGSQQLLRQTTQERIQGLGQSLSITRTVTAAEGELVSANVAASASLGLLEGRTLGVNRAAAQFLTRILGFGPALQTAFSYVVGPVVLISVIYMIGTALDNAITKFKLLATTISVNFQKATDEVRTSVLSLTTENDKLQEQLDKLQHKPTENGGAIALDEMTESANRLAVMLDKDTETMDALIKKNTVGFWDRVLGMGGTSDIAKLGISINNQIKTVKDSYDSTIQYASNNGASKSNIAEIKAAEINKLIKVYADGDAKLTPLIQGLQKKMQDFNDPTMKATGMAGSDPSAQLALAVGIQQKFLADQQQIGESYRKDNLTAQIEPMKAGAAAAAQSAKEVRAQWTQALQSFKDYELGVAKQGTAATPQQKLDWWNTEQPKLSSGNQGNARGQQLKYQNQVDSQTFGADALKKMQDQTDALLQYGDAQKVTTETDRDLQEAAAKRLTLDPQLVEQLRSLELYNLSLGKAQKAENDILKESTAAENTHKTMLAAAAVVLQDHPELYARITQAVNKETEAWENANDPLREYSKNIDDQMALMGKYGQQLEIETKLQALQNENVAKGHALDNLQIASAREQLENLSNAEELHSDLAKIYGNETDSLRKLTIQQQAYNQAHAAGKMNDEQYKNSSAQNWQQQQQLQNNGTGSAKGIAASPLTSYVAQYKGIADSIQSVMDTAFAKMADGAAQTFAKIIVYGGNMGKAFKDLGKQLLESILSSLIKIAIQALIVDVIFKALHIGQGSGDNTATTEKNTAVSIAAIGVITAAQLASLAILSPPAWDLAEAVSLASFGANSIPAETGIAAVVAAGSAQKFANGGFVSGAGSSTSDSIPAFLSNGEYVLNAQTTRALGGKQQLDAVQQGAKSVSSNSPGLGGSPLVGNSSSPKMTIEDHTGGVKWQTVQIGHDEMRVIARDEGKKAVYQHADKAVSQAVNNPNSATSKQFKQKTNVTQRRVN